MRSAKLYRALNSILLIISVPIGLFMLWTVLRLVTDCAHPILVVSSESMEPTFFRGDIILLSNRRDMVQVGDIPVVWSQEGRLPMVHRAVKVANSVGTNKYEIV
jgi:signal peptidase